MQSFNLNLVNSLEIAGEYDGVLIDLLNTERFAITGKADFAGSFELYVANDLADTPTPWPKGFFNFAANDTFGIKGRSNFRFLKIKVIGTGIINYVNLFTKANDE